MGRRKGQDITGVLLLDKPVDLSSNHALQRARRAFDAKKAGHTGTLDPFATGLLVCCFGKATKICGPMLEADKRYEATLTLGSETDSGDITGETTQSCSSFEGLSKADLEAVLPQFIGQIEQIPPMHSALKKDGKPLYKYAREGIVIDRPARQITIYSIDILEFSSTQVTLDVACSKGTYIRTLAQDIGRSLGCLAYLSALRRTEVGPFKLNESVSLETLQNTDDTNLNRYLIPIKDVPEQWVPKKLLLKENL